MENIILSENQRWHAIWDDAPKTPIKRSKWLHMSQDKHDNIIAKAQAKHLFRILKEPCPHGVGDFHDKDEPVTMCMRLACSECLAEIEKEIEK